MNKFYALIISLFLILTTGCVYFSSIPPDQQIKEVVFKPIIAYESLHFFSSGEKGLEKSLRVYTDRFGENSVDWIWYELIVKNISETDGNVFFSEIWNDGEGNVISKTDKEMIFRSKDSFLEYTAGIKTEWRQGYYELNLYIDSLKIAGKEFQIVN